MPDVINLVKGQTIDLTKHAPTVKNYYIGLGWKSKGRVDADASVFPCDYRADGSPHLLSPPYFVFYNQLESPCGGILHSPDDRDDGDSTADGDREWISIQSAVLDSRIKEIAAIVTIDGAPANGQSFRDIYDAYIRICELDHIEEQLIDGQKAKVAIPGKEITRYKLEDAGDFTAVQFGSLVTSNGAWDFEAVGQGYKADLNQIVHQYMPEAVTKTS